MHLVIVLEATCMITLLNMYISTMTFTFFALTIYNHTFPFTYTSSPRHCASFVLISFKYHSLLFENHTYIVFLIVKHAPTDVTVRFVH